MDHSMIKEKHNTRCGRLKSWKIAYRLNKIIFKYNHVQHSFWYGIVSRLHMKV